MIQALLIDVHLTMLHPRQPVARTYASVGRSFGVTLTEGEIARRFASALDRVAESTPMTGDGRKFWAAIVADATGSTDPEYLEALYNLYTLPDTWSVEPGFVDTCARLRKQGCRVAYVSNADNRLRPLLASLGLLDVVDAAIISAEVGVEKPARAIFDLACTRLGVAPSEAVHVGDSRRADVVGALNAGIEAWHWGTDVKTMADVERRILSPR